MELSTSLRPELHRYCARMTGSVFDGEDVLQETLAKAYYALGQMREPPNLKPWLFRIAHNTAMDFLRRYERKNVDLVPDVPDRAEPEDAGVDPTLVEAALSGLRGVAADPTRRAHPQGRARTFARGDGGDAGRHRRCGKGGAVPSARQRRPHACERVPAAGAVAIGRRAGDAEAIRGVLQFARLGRAAVAARRRIRRRHRIAPAASCPEAGYYDRYAEIIKVEDLRAEVGSVDGVPAIAVFRMPSSAVPAYFILLESEGGRAPAFATSATFRTSPRRRNSRPESVRALKSEN